jgi:hypothetical protein
LDQKSTEEKQAEPVNVRRITVDELTKYPDRELAQLINDRLLKKHVAEREQQLKIVRSTHARGHFGAEKIYNLIWNDGYYWPGLRKDCQQVVSCCRSCLQYNVGREGFRPVQSMRAVSPWDHIAVDCAVNLPETAKGHKNIFILVDLATRFVITLPLKSMEMLELSEKLYMVLCMFGPPKIMQSDNGTEFINALISKLMQAAGVDHRQVASYNPRANGLAERTVGTVKRTLLKKLEGMLEHWDDALLGVTHAINVTESRLFKSSPFSLFFGRSPNTWTDYHLAEVAAQ